MHPETLQVVEKIIAPRNPGEKVIDLRRALLAGGIKCVAHQQSLATLTVQGKAQKFLCASSMLC